MADELLVGVDWGGTKIGFTEVSGLEVSTEKIEYRDGVSPEYVKLQMLGQLTLPEWSKAYEASFIDQ